MKMPYLRSIFAAVLAAVAASATLPARASTFSVGGSGNTFIITRSGEGTNAAETVRYRTVGLSAYAGATVTLAYAGTVPAGYTLTYSASAGTLDGDRLTMLAADVTVTATLVPPPYPAYLDEADNNVIDNYDEWAARYGYDVLGVNETAFLLDVAPGAVTNGVTPLKIAELGSTNVLVAGSVYENMMWEYRIDYDEDYLPCRRIVLESGVGALKPGPWREYSGTPSSFDICNGYVVLRFTHDLSLPKSEWWAISWFVDFEGDRAVVLVPTMFKEHIRMVVEQQLNRPVSGLFLSVGIEPYTVIDPDTILTFFPMPPLVE